MGIVSNNQSFNSSASSGLIDSLGQTFIAQMHTVLLGGRDISLDLPPEQTACPSPDCKYNSTYKRYTGLNTAFCRTCGGNGFIIEPRQTIYRANIRHIGKTLKNPRSGGEGTPGGRIFESDIRTKTHIASLDHINQCISATIDGFKCTLSEDVEITGWGSNLHFVIAYWKKSNKKLSNG